MDLSSSGASSDGSLGASRAAIPKERTNKPNATHLALKKNLKDFSYPSFILIKNGSVFLYSQLCWEPAFSKYALIIGDSVRATKAEIRTDPETTIANSRNNLPVIPPKNNIGRNTAARVIVVEMTAK